MAIELYDLAEILAYVLIAVEECPCSDPVVHVAHKLDKYPTDNQEIRRALTIAKELFFNEGIIIEGEISEWIRS